MGDRVFEGGERFRTFSERGDVSGELGQLCCVLIQASRFQSRHAGDSLSMLTHDSA